MNSRGDSAQPESNNDESTYTPMQQVKNLLRDIGAALQLPLPVAVFGYPGEAIIDGIGMVIYNLGRPGMHIKGDDLDPSDVFDPEQETLPQWAEFALSEPDNVAVFSGFTNTPNPVQKFLLRLIQLGFGSAESIFPNKVALVLTGSIRDQSSADVVDELSDLIADGKVIYFDWKPEFDEVMIRLADPPEPNMVDAMRIAIEYNYEITVNEEPGLRLETALEIVAASMNRPFVIIADIIAGRGTEESDDSRGSDRVSALISVDTSAENGERRRQLFNSIDLFASLREISKNYPDCILYLGNLAGKFSEIKEKLVTEYKDHLPIIEIPSIEADN